MILAIDTSAAQCAVALSGEGLALARCRPMARGHAEELFPMIESLLAEAGASYGDVARVAVCTGPGSFTGVRIGVAAARGLALALGVPAIGVSRFEALAAEVGGPVAVALAGPQETVFLQLFDAGLLPLGPPRRIPSEALGAAVPGGIALAGDAAFPSGREPRLARGLVDPLVLARRAGVTAGTAPASPLYLRDAGAEPPREAAPPLLD